jgi:MFS family permease
LVNYLDRQVLYILLPQVQTDLRLKDFEAGRLASAFMFVYMLAAPPIGYFADKHGRKFWIALGVGLWSLATMASGLATTFTALFLARAAVGIGESCYGAISPSFVAEHFPSEKRGSVLAWFSMAIPVGSALGYVVGGVLGQHWGWRNAFYVVGLPGLILAYLASRLKEPPRTIESAPSSAFTSYRGLFRIPSFNFVTLAMAAMTFSLGGYAVWMPSFFHRAWGLDLSQAGQMFGGITVVSGLLGSLAGGWLADRVLKFNSRAHVLISGLGLMLGMPVAMIALVAKSFHAAAAALFVAEFFLFLNMGPLNAVIVAVTELKSRSMAFAANILVLHALGDAVSPMIIGAASDKWGLQAALIGASLPLGISGALCFLGMAHYDRDAAKVAYA